MKRRRWILILTHWSVCSSRYLTTEERLILCVHSNYIFHNNSIWIFEFVLFPAFSSTSSISIHSFSFLSFFFCVFDFVHITVFPGQGQRQTWLHKYHLLHRQWLTDRQLHIWEWPRPTGLDLQQPCVDQQNKPIKMKCDVNSWIVDTVGIYSFVAGSHQSLVSV